MFLQVPFFDFVHAMTSAGDPASRANDGRRGRAQKSREDAAPRRR